MCVAWCRTLHCLPVGSYVLQYLGGKLYLAPFVTQALVQVCVVCVQLFISQLHLFSS